MWQLRQLRFVCTVSTAHHINGCTVNQSFNLYLYQATRAHSSYTYRRKKERTQHCTKLPHRQTRKKRNSSRPTYCINNQTFALVDCIYYTHDLGVTNDCQLKFDKHITGILRPGRGSSSSVEA